MAASRTPFHERIKGPMQENEDWWTLLTDTETGQQLVEHKWRHMHRQGGELNEGEKTVPLAVFMEARLIR